VERFILWECELFSERWDILSFLLWFRGLSEREKEEFLLKVIERYGVGSEQFYFVVQGFVVYVIMRHGVGWDEDVFQEAFLAIMEKVRYWDKSKGSLMSFLYSLVRDRVSQRKYWEMVKLVRDVDLNEWLKYEDEEGERCVVGMVSEDDIDNIILLEEVGGRLVRGLRGEVLESVMRGEDSVYRRVILWHVVKGIDAMV
jgi:DNA-directed RNA polymerase specialized sigma24 family protein